MTVTINWVKCSKCPGHVLKRHVRQWNSPLSMPSVWRWWTSRREHDNGQMHEWAREWPLCSYGPDYEYYSGTKQSRRHQNKRSSIICTIYSHFTDSILSLTWAASPAWIVSTHAAPLTPTPTYVSRPSINYKLCKPSPWLTSPFSSLWTTAALTVRTLIHCPHGADCTSVSWTPQRCGVLCHIKSVDFGTK